MLIHILSNLNHSYNEKRAINDILNFMLPLSTNIFLQANEEHCFGIIDASFWTLEVH